MNKDNLERCTQCPKECLSNELKCGRGRKFFNETSQDEGKKHHDHHGQKDLTHLLMRCGYILEHKTNRRGQSRILKLLAENELLSQKELQQKLEIEAGSLSETIAKLEARGLILREKDEQDKRRMLVRLSEQGQLAASQETIEDPDAIYDVLSDEEKAELQAILIKLTDKWSFDYHGTKDHHRHHKSKERNGLLFKRS